MSRRIVLGVGTGRCGTTSLARLLNGQADCHVTHEEWPLLAWDEPQPEKRILARLERWESERDSPIMGDAASFYLPYVEAALESGSDVRVIGLRRDRDEVIASFSKWLDRTQPLPTDHWTDRPQAGRHHDPFWSSIFPKYGEATREAGIGRYWDEYDARLSLLVERWPKRVRVWEMDALSDAAGRREMLLFAGISELEQVADDVVHANQSESIVSRAVPGMTSDDPRRCVVLVPYRAAVSPGCEESLRVLEQRGYVVRRVPAEGAVDQLRSRLATVALREEFSELLWVDSMAQFDASAVETLRRHSLPMACGVAPRPRRRALDVEVMPGTDMLTLGVAGGLVNVRSAGMSLMHVRREVLELVQLRERLPISRDVNGEWSVPFFEPMTIETVDGYQALNSQQAFCERVRRCGLDVQADTSVRIAVEGRYRFDWEDAGQEKVRYEAYRYRLE